MAPFVPEELDVFTIPHSRMKELVCGYVAKLEKTNFSDYVDMQQLLRSLSEAFQEFKKHEQIENNLIMKKLKNKLKQLSIRNSAVCNCHKDSHLTEILHLVEDGYTKKTVQDRVNYGLQLRKKLEDFTEDFLPHMQQEEEVFQPLLLQYFTHKELCELRKTVIQLHLQKKDDKSKDPWQFLKHLKGHNEEEFDADEKDDYCEYLSKVKEARELQKDKTAEKDETDKEKKVTERDKLEEKSTEAVPPDKTIQDLPNELLLKVMSYMGPRDLGMCQQVCRDWSVVAKDPSLWRELHPVKWAQGEWNYRIESPVEELEDEEEDEASDGEQYILLDEDADVDESADADEENAALKEIKHEAKMLTGLAKHVLPSVGQGVRVLNLGHSRALTSGLLHRMLKCCPNVEYLDLTQTKISDSGLKELGKNYCGSQLKKLILSGCVNVTDATLVRLAVALSRPCICGNKNSNETTKETEAPNPVGKETEGQEEAKESKSSEQMPTYAEHDIESLPENYIVKERPISRDKVEDCNKRLSLVQMMEDYCMCVEYQDNQQMDGWVDKENSIWKNYVDSTCLERDKNYQRGRMKGADDGGGSCGEFSRQCANVADGPCCRRQIDVSSWVKDGGGPCAEKYGMSHHPPPSLIEGDGPPNAVVARDKFNGQDAVTARFKKDCCQVSVMGSCHEGCRSSASDSNQLAIEDCAVAVPFETTNREAEDFDEYADDIDEGPPVPVRRQLQYLSLSGCYQITDFGLSTLADCGAFADLYGIDLSGCAGLTGPGIEALVNMCPALDPEHLYYCDNIIDGPLLESASGCRNQQCGARYCCRMLLAQ